MHDLLLLFAREQAGHDEPETQRRAALERMLDCYLATMQAPSRYCNLATPAVRAGGWRRGRPR
jgi:hypothetical protein